MSIMHAHVGLGNQPGSSMGQADLAHHGPGLGHDFRFGLVRYQAETHPVIYVGRAQARKQAIVPANGPELFINFGII
jgi:hypothetical protein